MQITDLEKFRILKNSTGVFVISDDSSNTIHTRNCSLMDEASFIQKAITERSQNTKYFAHDNVTHALKNHANANLCITCTPQLIEKTIALNTSGTFLQISVVDILKRKRWSTQTEFPITLAPFFKDPMKYPGIDAGGVGTTRSSLFQQAVNESQNQFLRKETSIDVVATFGHENDDYIMCSEIKKRNPKYVDWCFFRENVDRDEFRFVTKSRLGGGMINLLHVDPTDTGHPALDIQIEKFDRLSSFQPVCCDYGVALHREDSGGYKFQNSSLSEAARQCIEGTYGMIVTGLVNQVSTGLGYAGERQIFIPIVVTNANLLLCKYDMNDVDIQQGEVSKINFEKINHVLYECPLPMTVHFPNTISGVRNYVQQIATIRWQVLIVNPAGLNELLTIFQDNVFRPTF